MITLNCSHFHNTLHYKNKRRKLHRKYHVLNNHLDTHEALGDLDWATEFTKGFGKKEGEGRGGGNPLVNDCLFDIQQFIFRFVNFKPTVGVNIKLQSSPTY